MNFTVTVKKGDQDPQKKLENIAHLAHRTSPHRAPRPLPTSDDGDGATFSFGVRPYLGDNGITVTGYWSYLPI